jgi:Holliday junction resolvase-like predicted endonuclease
MTFTEIEIEERNLEAAIIKNPGAIEKGLTVLDHQVPAGTGKIDILGVDSGGILTIIELKVTEDDTVLMQSVEYYDWVSQNTDRLAERYREKSPKVDIDAEEAPRLILVAPTFSLSLKTCCKYINADVDLFEYVYLKAKTGEKGIFCKRVDLGPPATPPSRPLKEEDHINYITNPAMKQVCKEAIGQIKGIGEDIEVRPTRSVLSFKHANRVIAYIDTKREFFYIYFPRRGRNWVWQAVEKKRDFPSDILEGIRDFYHKLKRE